tara:strand:+ start:75 stop:737 length:663 start_codon:yes stop_codon:yes gene_type:complete
MIPVRKGSRRVPGKALRKIGNITLLEQSISLALTYFSSSEIYLNTDWEELQDISLKYKINFFKRDQSYTTSTSTNDEFMNDFLLKVDCERVIQLLPTSPFVLKKEFVDFCNIAALSKDKALVSVGSHRIASVLEDGTPINFTRKKQNPPSETMKAVYSYVGVLMSWKRNIFLKDFMNKECAYHGSSDNKYFPLRFLSQLDIDTEDDLEQAQLLSDQLPIH